MKAREVRLRSRPTGLPAAEDFEIATVELKAPGAGEVLVRNIWMSVDPYMRGLDDFGILRFMQTQETVTSDIRTWADRRDASDSRQSSGNGGGVTGGRITMIGRRIARALAAWATSVGDGYASEATCEW